MNCPTSLRCTSYLIKLCEIVFDRKAIFYQIKIDVQKVNIMIERTKVNKHTKCQLTSISKVLGNKMCLKKLVTSIFNYLKIVCINCFCIDLTSLNIVTGHIISKFYFGLIINICGADILMTITENFISYLR